VIWNRFREVDHHPEDGSIDCRADCDERHGSFLRVNRLSLDTATIQSGLYKGSEPIGQVADISRGQQYGKQRRRTHQEQKRLSIDDDSIHVPVTKRCVGSWRGDTACR
jgi:hypothetical protein